VVNRTVAQPPDSLPARYLGAWHAVCAALAADAQVLGATISGSILRGQGGPTSDLDVYVLVEGEERWRRTFVCEGVLVEEFRNPEPWIRRYVERRDDAPGLHMLGHGQVVLDRDPRFATLRELARAACAQGPRPLAEAELHFRRYMLWDAWCDVKDMLVLGHVEAARGLIQRETHQALALHHVLAGRWLPKVRDLLPALDGWDATAAREVRVLWSAAALDPGVSAAAYDRLIRRVLAPHDPDEPMLWVSQPQRLEDAPSGPPPRDGRTPGG
jgi:predicted nucleotidyltransferase